MFFFFAGFTVLRLVIDYFLGDPINLHLDKQGFDITAWFAKSRQRAKEGFPKWIKEVREIYGGYGTEGFFFITSLYRRECESTVHSVSFLDSLKL